MASHFWRKSKQISSLFSQSSGVLLLIIAETMAMAQATMFFRQCGSETWEGPLLFRIHSRINDTVRVMVLEYENEDGKFVEWTQLGGYVTSMPLKSESFYVFLLEVTHQPFYIILTGFLNSLLCTVVMYILLNVFGTGSIWGSH